MDGRSSAISARLANGLGIAELVQDALERMAIRTIGDASEGEVEDHLLGNGETSWDLSKELCSVAKASQIMNSMLLVVLASEHSFVKSVADVDGCCGQEGLGNSLK